MASIGGDIGGKVGAGESVNQFQFPYFTSPGGVTPQQTALANYDYGQNLLEALAAFGSESQPGGGASLSTMATQAAGGANIGRALDLSHMSDVDQQAKYEAFRNSENIAQQNSTNAIAEQNQNLAALTGGLNTLTGALGSGNTTSTQAGAGATAGQATPLPGSST